MHEVPRHRTLFWQKIHSAVADASAAHVFFRAQVIIRNVCANVDLVDGSKSAKTPEPLLRWRTFSETTAPMPGSIHTPWPPLSLMALRLTVTTPEPPTAVPARKPFCPLLDRTLRSTTSVIVARQRGDSIPRGSATISVRSSPVVANLDAWPVPRTPTTIRLA